jgi:hypothetical protein
MTRAFLALASGDLGRAVFFHPMALLLAFEALLAWLGWGAYTLGHLPRVAASWEHLALAHSALLLALWFVRLATNTLPG